MSSYSWNTATELTDWAREHAPDGGRFTCSTLNSQGKRRFRLYDATGAVVCEEIVGNRPSPGEVVNALLRFTFIRDYHYAEVDA